MTTWQDPPAKTGRHAKYMTSEVVAELRANPGRWLLLDHHAKRAGISVRTWVTRNPGFETTCRSSGEALDIYVRYVGEQ